MAKQERVEALAEDALREARNELSQGLYSSTGNRLNNLKASSFRNDSASRELKRLEEIFPRDKAAIFSMLKRL